MTLNQRGNGTDYTLRRLARDNHDDLLDAIERNELTVNADSLGRTPAKQPTTLRQVVKVSLASLSRLLRQFDATEVYRNTAIQCDVCTARCIMVT